MAPVYRRTGVDRSDARLLNRLNSHLSGNALTYVAALAAYMFPYLARPCPAASSSSSAFAVRRDDVRVPAPAPVELAVVEQPGAAEGPLVAHVRDDVELVDERVPGGDDLRVRLGIREPPPVASGVDAGVLRVL